MCRSIASNVMSLLDNLKVYSKKAWEVKDEETLTKESLERYKSVELVSSDIGISVLCVLKNGDKQFLPFSRDSKIVTEVTKESMVGAKILKLGRPGDDDIYRIEF